MKTQISNCLYCAEPIKGRSDKKFCDDCCRNAYNNAQRALDNGSMQSIMKVLQKNRAAIKTLLKTERTKTVSKDDLIREGYNFKYHTHHFISRNKTEYIFCFDYGYKDDGKQITVVKAFESVLDL
jgi:predicted nucleic acid-binding Zn ribbon protein